MEARYRLGGVLCLLLAGAIAWQGISLPLQEASLGAESITRMPRATVVLPGIRRLSDNRQSISPIVTSRGKR
ncbi:hypothetical protein [Rhizobium lentis]|uniref:Uncharacterized protein n=1 Tax=Rhizobium lentis TaxID=1138194 RepID=A0A7W8UIR3_9HYPH|nr:hypothetical protein [Rhizobium lentis]MBB4572563.1 hypothetical protein [Rhizobium lentis]MBB5548248.1 hypothetical protein [Rhizobium lentis]MBB5558776.1 hypothetical protein [Rhizobium lentis]MBB5565700.1 hypothetical protein [Rhizobium lentis]